MPPAYYALLRWEASVNTAAVTLPVWGHFLKADRSGRELCQDARTRKHRRVASHKDSGVREGLLDEGPSKLSTRK